MEARRTVQSFRESVLIERTHMKRLLVILLFATAPLTPGQTKPQTQAKGVLLENLPWIEAEKVLTRDTVVVIPLGAAAKEHGPHLKLKNDWILAEYLKRRVLAASQV